MFICQLSAEKQSELRNVIEFYGLNEGYRGVELEEMIENAMSGRVCDLDGIIDLEKMEVVG